MVGNTEATRVVRSPQAITHLRREVCAASALNHPNICVIYDID
jgi:hypothetical protein